MRALAVLVLTGCGVVGCWAASPGAKVDLAAEADAVRAANAAVNAAIHRKDLQAVTAAYAPGAILLWQDERRITGAAIPTVWAQAFGAAGFALRLRSRTVTVAQAGDLALDEGSLEIDVPTPGGIRSLPGKYLLVWKKVGAGWKVLYDVYNTDPAPPTTSRAR